jgi:hypothetical protein
MLLPICFLEAMMETELEVKIHKNNKSQLKMSIVCWKSGGCFLPVSHQKKIEALTELFSNRE